MKTTLIAISLALLASSAFAQNSPGAAGAPGSPPKEAPKPPVVASAEYSTAFCLGWSSAVAMEQQRFQNWRALIMVGRKPEDGSEAKLLTDSAAIYVLLPALTGKVTTNESVEVDCTAKPVKRQAAPTSPQGASGEPEKKP